MKLQDKLQEIKDEVSVKHGYRSWDVAVHDVISPARQNQITDQAMIAFAAYCCERQRESDAEAADINNDSCYREGGYCLQTDVDKSSILNNPLITD